MNQTSSLLTAIERIPVAAQPAISIGALNEMLRGEIAGSEAYRHASASWTGTGVDTLHACQRSHEGSMKLLHQRIEMLGGQAVQDSGLWGIFSRSAGAAASTIGLHAILTVLVEGEDHRLEKQHWESAVLDEVSYVLVRDTLLPRQEAIMARVRALLADERQH